jgi:uncharacterized protein (TIGR03435 family)
MTRALISVMLTLLAGPSVIAQDPARVSAPLAFGNVSIAPNTSGKAGPGALRLQPGGVFLGTNVTVRELIEYAYQRHAFDRREVIGGPAWIDADRFDVAAEARAGQFTVDADASFRDAWAMIRALLGDRFKPQVHEENSIRPIYALMMASADGSIGPKLQKTDVDCSVVAKGPMPALRPGQSPPCSVKTPPGRLFVNTVGMATIASLLSRHVDRPVIDYTGLTGRFDMQLGRGRRVPDRHRRAEVQDQRKRTGRR